MEIKEIEEMNSEEDREVLRLDNLIREIPGTNLTEGTTISQATAILQGRATSVEVHLNVSQVPDLHAITEVIEAILNKDHQKVMVVTLTEDQTMTETVHHASSTGTIEVATSGMVPAMTITTSHNTLLAIRCRATLLITCAIEIIILRTRQIITETNSNSNIATKREEDLVIKTSTGAHHQGNVKANSTDNTTVDLAPGVVRDFP